MRPSQSCASSAAGPSWSAAIHARVQFPFVEAGLDERDAALVTGKKYLERYLYLVLYEGYVCCCLDTRSSVYRPPGDGRDDSRSLAPKFLEVGSERSETRW